MRDFEIQIKDGQNGIAATVKNFTNKRLFFVFENVRGYNFDINPYECRDIQNDEHGWETLRLFAKKQYVVFRK